MTEPERTPHTSKRAEGDPPGDREVDRRPPRPEQPAEGEDRGEGADTPDA